MCIRDSYTPGSDYEIATKKYVDDNDANDNTQNTYASSWVDSSDDVLLRLTTGGAGSGTQDIKLVAGTGISLTPSGTNMTIANTVSAPTDYLTNNAADIMSVSDFGAVAALKIDADQPATTAAEDSAGLSID